jgi:hypothetical protein
MKKEAGPPYYLESFFLPQDFYVQNDAWRTVVNCPIRVTALFKEMVLKLPDSLVLFNILMLFFYYSRSDYS